ncbi:hypothetical protein IW261DRAFT_1424484 [Armillaria novae-zelandiae]|uniref:Uncharacterized protein n=1 Tax=Armillaria novae-zelandiae TaxID=153914 RepID=A0AA39NUS5_9AGAR|nr:hypothetical protein IW261DRAFT_1424484 [Armillaria novae-zelandiae]
MMLKPVTDHMMFINPKPSLAPVKGLKIEKGLCCKKCLYAVHSMKLMQRHWYNIHKSEIYCTPKTWHWHEGWVQNIFPVPMQFFSVEPSSAKHSNAREGDPFTIFLKTVVPVIEKESIQVLPNVIWPWEVPLLVKMMEWHLHLTDYITDHHKVQKLCTLVKPSPKRVKGSISDLIYQAVFEYLDAIGELHCGLTILEKQLLFNPDNPLGQFTMHDEHAMQLDYGYLLFIFVYAILTSRAMSITDYKFPLTTLDHKSAERFMKALENKRLNLEASEDLHSFLVYAKFKYAIYCTCLFEANKRQADFNDSLYLAIKHYTKQMLSSESGTSPFMLDTEAQKFTSGLALSQPSPPTTCVSADGLTIFYRDTKFHVPSWRAGLYQMMDFVIGSQDGKESRGYSWLNNADFGIHSYALVKNLMVDPSNVNHTKEFVEHKISNSTRPWMVLRSGLEMWFIICYVKKENIVQKAAFIPVLVPPELCIQLECYLILIRPLEDGYDDSSSKFLQGIQHGHTVQTAHRIYAPEVGHLPSMSSKALLWLSAASKAWWNVTGFVPGESPIPLHEDTEVADVVETIVRKETVSFEARLQEKMEAITNSMDTVAHSVSRTVEGMIQQSGHTFE